MNLSNFLQVRFDTHSFHSEYIYIFVHGHFPKLFNPFGTSLHGASSNQPSPSDTAWRKERLPETRQSTLVWLYSKSTIVGYLMPNPVFTYILDKQIVNTFCRYTQLNDQTVLFLTIQFSISHLVALSSIASWVYGV